MHPARVDALDARGHAVDDVGGVADLDLDDGQVTGPDGDVEGAQLGPHVRPAPRPRPGRRPSAAVRSRSRSRRRRRRAITNRPAALTAPVPRGDVTSAPTAAGSATSPATRRTANELRRAGRPCAPHAELEHLDGRPGRRVHVGVDGGDDRHADARPQLAVERRAEVGLLVVRRGPSAAAAAAARCSASGDERRAGSRRGRGPCASAPASSARSSPWSDVQAVTT